MSIPSVTEPGIDRNDPHPSPRRGEKPAPPQPSNKARKNQSEPHLDLLKIVAGGAVFRRHRFWKAMQSLLVPAAVSSVLVCAIYLAFFLRAARFNPLHLGITLAVLLVVPLIVSVLLAAVRRNKFRFTAALAATFVAFNFAVVVLSAMRIQVSYTGLFCAASAALIIAAISNARLRKGFSDTVAILDFPLAQRVRQEIGGRAVIVKAADEDISAYDEILIDGETHHTPKWSRLLTRAHMLGASISPWISYLEQRTGCVDIDQFDLSHLGYTPSQIYFAKSKRVFDLALLVLALPVVLPIGALIWMYIKLVDRKAPAIFVQTRRGYAGKNFRMYKFRTMYRGTQGGAARQNDARIMPGCRLIRRMRLDELPQLWNIWRGQMSWVGPRPESIELAKRYEKAIPQYVLRLLTRPGITGWAQVHFGYTTNVKEARIKLAYDLYYIKNISLDLEIETLLRTVRTLLLREGAR